MFSQAPRKQLGQHFLTDTSVISNIIQSIGLDAADKVIEIGPGRGALTYPMLRFLNQLIAIEFDRDLYQDWLAQAYPNLTIHHADALGVDFSQWGKAVRLVGNLPYNISSPFLIHLLDYLPSIQSMHFMLQKEVVTRLCAQPGTKAFGRLSVMMQAFCEVELCFDVPPSAFFPPPRVDSAVVRLVPRQGVTVDKVRLEGLVSRAFAMKRKTIANNLKGVFSAQQLEGYGIDPKVRPEGIEVWQYIALSAGM